MSDYEALDGKYKVTIEYRGKRSAYVKVSKRLNRPPAPPPLKVGIKKEPPPPPLPSFGVYRYQSVDVFFQKNLMKKIDKVIWKIINEWEMEDSGVNKEVFYV